MTRPSGVEQAQRQLVDRARVGLWVIIASNLLFALTDLRLAHGELVSVYLLKLIQIVTAVAALRALRWCETRAAALAVIFVTAGVVSLAIAISGTVSADTATTVILLIALAWGAATLLPWGAAPQLGLAFIAGLGILVNLYMVHGDLSAAASYPAVAVSLVLGISVFLSIEFGRHRTALALENAVRTRAEDALRRSESDLRNIFDNVEDVFYRTDLDGTIQMISPSVERYGYRVGELLGRKSTIFYEDPETRARNISLLHERGSLQDVELSLRASDGRVIPLSANVHLLFNDQGKPVGLEGMLRDITERKRVEADLREARDALEQRVRERTTDLERANAQLRASASALRAGEQRFRMVSELTSDYAYAIGVARDLTATVEWLTGAAFTRITGFTPAEAEDRGGGMSVIDCADLPIARRRLETLLAGKPDVSEFRIITKDGSTRWIREHGFPEWDESEGRVVRIYGAAQDITEQRETNRRLEEQERFVSAILETVGALVGVVDTEGHVVRMNRACEETFGYALDEARGRYFWDLVPFPDEVKRAREVFNRLLAGRWPAAYDTYWFTRDGERRLLAWSTTFLTNDEGVVEYVIGTGIDITERRQAEDAVRRSEEHFRALIEHATDLISVLDVDGTIRYLSPSITHILGYSPDSWVGRNAFDLVHPDDRVAVGAAIQAGIAHVDTGLPMAFRARHSDGSWRVLEGTDTNLLENDAVRGIVINARDITERKQAEEALQGSEEQYRLLFDSNPCPMWVFDRETLAFLNVNEAAIRHYGYSREQFLTMTITDVRPSEEAPRLLTRISVDTDELVSADGPWIHRKRDGTLIEVEISACNLVFEGRRAVLVLANDVTPRIRAEREIRRLNAELEQRVVERTTELKAANNELAAFSYSVSHDLRAPLRRIDGWSGALLEDYGESLAAPAHQYLASVRHGVHQMSELIEGLLLLSRVTRGDLQWGPVDLSAMAHELVADLRTAEPQRCVTFLICDHLTARGDCRLLRTMLENLFGNAWKYSSQHPHARIEFGTVERGGETVYFVRDNGVGFDMAYADKLFGTFQRLHGAEFEGTGVGLATVQRIVQRHGGRIWAEAMVEKGATFYVTLPATASSRQSPEPA